MVRGYLALMFAGVAVLAVACQSDGGSGGGTFGGEDELSRERCEELTDVKPGNLIVFDESLTDEQKLECTSLLFSTSSGSGGDGESTAEWSANDVATFTEEQCGTNPSGMNEGVPVSTSVCECYLEETAEKYTSYNAWNQAGVAAGFDFSNEWYTNGFAVLADCGS